MINEELKQFIKNSLAKGVPAQTIKTQLLSTGWSVADIDEGLKAIPQPAMVIPPVSPIGITSQTTTPLSSVHPILTTPTTTPAKKSHVALVIGIVIVILLAAGGAYAYYSGLYESVVGSLFSSPEEEIMHAFVKAKAQESGIIETDISVDLSQVTGITEDLPPFIFGEGAEKKVSLVSKSSYTTKGDEDPKTISELHITVGSLSAGLEQRYLDKKMYLQLVQAPIVPDMFDLSGLVGKWAVIDLAEKNTNGFDLTGFLDPTSLFSEDLSQDEKNKLNEIVSNLHIITVTEKFDSETVNGVATNHYAFDLDRAGISDGVRALVSFFAETKGEGTAPNVTDAEIQEALGIITNFSSEIWIGKRDGLPYKLTISFDAVDPDDVVGEKYQVVIETTFQDWGKDIAINPPESSTPIEELVSEALDEGPLGESRGKAVDAQTSSNISSFRAEAELFFMDQESYRGFCAALDRRDMIVTCRDAASGYVIFAPLTNSNDNFCVDATGFAGAIYKNRPITGLTCPQ